MNKERRKEIDSARTSIAEAGEEFKGVLEKLGKARDTLEQAKSDEEDYKENMPEGLKSGEKGEQADSAINALEEAISAIEEFEQMADKFDDIDGHLETASE